MIKLIKSTFYNEEYTKKRLASFVRSADYLSFGDECKRFEQQFAIWQKRAHCIVVNSGSSANLAIIQALLNLKKLTVGDTVGFSAVTWSTNVMPLIQLGLNPMPIDVDLKTLNVSSETLLQAIKSKPIKMLFLTNLLGFCSDIDEIRNVCQARNILLIEDNCESLGTVYKKTKLGNFGLASTFSFYVGHHMSTVEGGAIVTNNNSLAEMLSLVRAHGWDRNLSFIGQEKIRRKYKVNSSFYSRYTFYDLGYNFRPTEMVGILGQIQLQFIDKVIQKREENFKYIARVLFKRNDIYYPIQYDHLDIISNFAFPLVCKTEQIREELVKLCDGKIEIRPIVGGDMTQQPFIKRYLGKVKVNCPNAHIIHKQGLYFGNNPELTKQEMIILIKTFSH